MSLHRNTYREKTRRITTCTNTYKHLNKNELRESKSFVMFCRMVSIESKAVILEFIFIKKFLLQFFFSQVKKVCQAHRAHLENVAIAVSLLLSLTNSLYCAFNEERWVFYSLSGEHIYKSIFTPISNWFGKITIHMNYLQRIVLNFQYFSMHFSICQ